MKDNLLLIANIILMGSCIISCAYSFIVSFITALWEAYDHDCKDEYKKCFISFFLCIGTLIATVILNTVFDNWV